jgi:hypothetical protein
VIANGDQCAFAKTPRVHQSLITEPFTLKKNAPGVTRTLDLRIRNPLLYPAELRAQVTLQYVGAETGKIQWAVEGSNDPIAQRVATAIHEFITNGGAGRPNG